MKTLILTRGNLPSDDRIKTLCREAEYVICCDGAAKHAVRLGILPNMLIGDMDSIDEDDRKTLIAGGAKEVRLKPDKDETDTQAACSVAMELGAQKLVMLGGLGGRMDHSLGNIQCLWMLHLEGVESRIESGKEVAYIVTDSFQFARYPGRTFSLIPLLPQTEVFRMTGVKYPLAHTPLLFGSTLGISNVVQQADAQITMQSGTALLCINLGEDDL